MVRSIVLRISAALAVALTAWAMVVATGSSATATQGQAVLAGQTNTETSETVVENTNVSVSCGPSAFDGFLACGTTGVQGSGSMTGVEGFGDTTGVFGSSSDTGVSGTATTTGVFGSGNTYGVYATSISGTGSYATSTSGEGVVGQSGSNNGVHGLTNGTTTSGVWGENEGGGYGVSGSTHGTGTAGVWGSNSQSGMGVKGTSPTGTGVYASGGGAALQVVGRAVFSRSGRATVPAGSKSVTVTGIPLTSASLVLAMVQVSGSVYVKTAVPNVSGSSFKLTLSKAPASATPVAWFVVN